MPTPGGPYSGIWKLKDISKYVQDDAWPSLLMGDIGLFAGGNTPTITNSIGYIYITSTSNSTDFGDLTEARTSASAVGNTTRAVWMSGYVGPASTLTMDYVQIASQGNAADFGDTTVARYTGAGAGSQTRGVNAGGYVSPAFQNVIDYITIDSLGNATDFGDLTVSRSDVAGLSSPTRAVFAGGSPGVSNVMDYVTIATTGNATDFGDLINSIKTGAGAASSTRGLFAGGGTGTYPADDPTNVIQYITIASTGNATDFGDLTLARVGLGGCSNNSRAVFEGGSTSPSQDSRNTNNTIDYVTIATTGNATDFGDLETALRSAAATSNSHGGLQ